MDREQAYEAQLKAQMRATEARIDELEAGARARAAKDEMEEISGLRRCCDQFRARLADAQERSRGDWGNVRRELDKEWSAFRTAVGDARRRYSEWDSARERRFNARLDEIDAAIRRSKAEDAEVAADARLQLVRARDALRAKATDARGRYDSWRERRADKRLLADLERSEEELDEAFDDYAVAREAVRNRVRRP